MGSKNAIQNEALDIRYIALLIYHDTELDETSRWSNKDGLFESQAKDYREHDWIWVQSTGETQGTINKNEWKGNSNVHPC